jgi:hypothetical protein
LALGSAFWGNIMFAQGAGLVLDFAPDWRLQRPLLRLPPVIR